MKRICLLLVLILVMFGCSPIVRAAVGIEFNVGYSPRITAPANPISFGTSQSVMMTVHSEDVDKGPELGLRLGLAWPLYSRNKNTIGVRLNTGHSAFINTASVYVSHSFGRFTPSIYVGATSYKHKGNVGDLRYTGTAAPVLTWGAELEFQVSPTFNLQASYQHTDRAFVYKHKYTYGPHLVILPSNYNEPVYSIHPSNSVYVGGSVNVDVLQYFRTLKSKRSSSIAADNDVRTSDNKLANKMFIEHSRLIYTNTLQAGLTPDIHATYQPFIDGVSNILDAYWNDKATVSVIGYIPQSQTLFLNIDTSFAFAFFDTLLLYKEISDVFLNEFVRSVGEMTKHLPSDVPPYISVRVKYRVYNTDLTIDTSRISYAFIKLDKSTDKGAQFILHKLESIW